MGMEKIVLRVPHWRSLIERLKFKKSKETERATLWEEMQEQLYLDPWNIPVIIIAILVIVLSIVLFFIEATSCK